MGQLALVRAEENVSEPENEAATFDDFWTLYPRHEAKKDARRAWDRMVDGDRLRAVVAIYSWRRVWAAQMREAKHMPLPATWLNGERWEDEIPQEYSRTAAAHVIAEVPKNGAREPMPQFVKDQIAKLRSARGH